MTRLAAKADKPAVIALWDRCGLVRPWNDPAKDFDRAVEMDSADILVAGDDDAIVASIMVGDDGHRGWVYYLAVSPERQRAGLGRSMMAGAEAWLRGRGCPKIQLMVRDGNDPAAKFYRALGYERQPVETFGRFL